MQYRGLLILIGLVGLSGLLTLILLYLELSGLEWGQTVGRPILLGGILLLQAGLIALIARGEHGWLGQRGTHQAPVVQPEEEYRRAIERELAAESARIDQQSRKLADRFRAIHEWMDYPGMLDLQTGTALTERPPEQPQESSVAREQRLAREDRQVQEILDSQAEVIYEKIRQNSYSQEGKFRPLLLRDDLLEMAVRVAQVYQPELEQPLLSTTPEQLARALNRIGLHLLVVMDQLPLDLKSYNIQKTYETMRKAITAYGAYRRASPYLNWATKGLYFGRMVTSTNPIALGLLWGATELGRFGAQKLATQLINRQAIGFLQSLIRVVGYEVAAIYGGDFRHRDSNWCYAVELTHMLAAFPPSRESLQYALRELGRLQLRNEYDRLCAYRCLAAGKVIDRRQTHPNLLTEQEKRQVVELLEKAYREVLHGRVSPQAGQWQQGVQEHLGLHLSLQAEARGQTQDFLLERDRQVVAFVLAWLAELKQVAPEELAEVTRRFSLLLSLQLHSPAEELRRLAEEEMAQLARQAFIEFVPPDLEPNDTRVAGFLETLCRLNAELLPLSAESEQILLETGLYYRRSIEEWAEKILEAYRQFASRQAPHVTRLTRPESRAIARALLWLQQEGGPALATVRDLYYPATPRFETGRPLPDELPGQLYCLVIYEDTPRLIRLGGLETEPEILWEANASTRVENVSSLLTAEASLTGGHTLPTNTGPALQSIHLQAPMTARYQTYFASLLDHVSAPSKELS